MKRKTGLITTLLLFTMGLTNCLVQTASAAETPLLDGNELFTKRDLQQTADLNGAVSLTMTSGRDSVVTKEGVYLLSGTYINTTLTIDVGDEAKVQLVLDGFNITNRDSPAIYVKSADKVFISTENRKSSLQVTGNYLSDGETHLDAVIFSRDDLTFNGTGSLEIISVQGNGISTKDDLKITGGALSITSKKDGLEANDSIRINGGNITVTSGKDALHSENDDDSSLGYIYINGGTLNISAADDGVQGTTIVQIDGGDLTVAKCQEGIEATHIQINGGNITISAQDDGINAAAKSPMEVVLEVNGGDINITMATGDTDAFDSNGDLYIRGGNIDVTARSAFDADKTAQMTGGNVTVNGAVVTQLTTQGFGGHGGGGRRH